MMIRKKPMKNTRIFPFCAALFALGVTGCNGGLKDQLGLTRDAPDEFAVITRAPLEMPPALVLPPPQPGMQRPQEKSPESRAKQAVFGNQITQTAHASGQSSSEAALLGKASTPNANPEIRAQLDQEAAEMAKRNQTVAQKLLGLGGQKQEPSANVVDAQAEAKRIQDNIKSGAPVTQGETPSIEE